MHDNGQVLARPGRKAEGLASAELLIQNRSQKRLKLPFTISGTNANIRGSNAVQSGCVLILFRRIARPVFFQIVEALPRECYKLTEVN
jgi:hypothetical protein